MQQLNITHVVCNCAVSLSLYAVSLKWILPRNVFELYTLIMTCFSIHSTLSVRSISELHTVATLLFSSLYNVSSVVLWEKIVCNRSPNTMSQFYKSYCNDHSIRIFSCNEPEMSLFQEYSFLNIVWIAMYGRDLHAKGVWSMEKTDKVTVTKRLYQCSHSYPQCPPI